MTHTDLSKGLTQFFEFLAATAAQEVTMSLRTYVRTYIRSMFFKNPIQG